MKTQHWESRLKAGPPAPDTGSRNNAESQEARPSALSSDTVPEHIFQTAAKQTAGLPTPGEYMEPMLAEIDRILHESFTKVRQVLRKMQLGVASSPNEQRRPRPITSERIASVLPQFPIYVAWQITGRCNARCIHCFSAVGPGGDGSRELSTAEALGVIDSLSASGVKALSFSGCESLLRDDWLILAQHAVARGLTVNLKTNGSPVNANTADMLQDASLHSVTVGLDSHLPAVHDRLRQSPGLFWKAVQAIMRLADRGLRVAVDFTPTQLNWRDGEEVIDLAQRLGARAINLADHAFSGRGRTIALGPREYRECLQAWDGYKAKYSGKISVIRHDCRVPQPHPEATTREHRGCAAGRFVARLLADGTVTPCPYMSVPLGAVRQETFEAIWQNSDLLEKLRRRGSHITGNCGACQYLEECGGCRAAACGADFGDPLGGDPQCWLKPYAVGK